MSGAGLVLELWFLPGDPGRAIRLIGLHGACNGFPGAG